MLLNDLRDKLSGEITFETKRNIVKQLVREVIVCTEHIEGKDRPDVNIHVKFVFSQVVMCTDMRANHNLDNTVFNGKVDQNIEMDHLFSRIALTYMAITWAFALSATTNKV
jgi:site-specific DNA recombinase